MNPDNPTLRTIPMMSKDDRELIDQALMQNTPEFRKFPKISRLENLTYTITEKLDGTNAVVHVSYVKDDNPTLGKVLRAGSRKQWLDEKRDNHGFYKFVCENAALLYRLDPGYHYGEFIGPGIQRKYQTKSGKSELYFFDLRLEERFRDSEVIHTVPLLETHSLSVPWKDFYLAHKANPSQIDGVTPKEGVMIHIPGINQRIKVIFDEANKIKD